MPVLILSLVEKLNSFSKRIEITAMKVTLSLLFFCRLKSLLYNLGKKSF